MRRVSVTPWKDPSEPEYQGWFHGWGVGHECYNEGVGNCTVAIVESDDGTVDEVPVRCVTFHSPPPKEEEP